MNMLRRIAAMIGFMVVLALALTLLYRVYIHHTHTEPFIEPEQGSVVRLDGRAV